MATTSHHKRKPGKRGKVTGWSPGAARRNVAFLRSVDETTLDGIGLALTLTVRNCPPTAAAWSTALTTWTKRQRRHGMTRLHWVMEFQRRGTPHLHVAIWYDDQNAQGGAESPLAGRGPLRIPSASQKTLGLQGVSNSDMQRATEPERHAGIIAIADWIDITSDLGTGPKGQHARPIEGPIGWFQYLAKHCGRGRQHYQRQQDNLPAAWSSSPRVWGKSGSWSTIDPADAELTQRQWWRLRRLIRAQRVARARAALPGPGWTWEAHVPLLTRPQLRDAPVGVLGKGRPLRASLANLKHARRMLKCGEHALSAVRGVSEWLTEDQQRDMLFALGITGKAELERERIADEIAQAEAMAYRAREGRRKENRALKR